MRVFYSTQFVLPLPPGHRFPMAKYQLLRDRVAAELPALELAQAEPATDGELALVHTPAYIAAISTGSVDERVCGRSAFPGARQWPSARGVPSAPPSPRAGRPGSRDCGEHRGRNPPRVRRQGRGFLRLQRRCRRGAPDAGRMGPHESRAAAGCDRGPGRAPGQRHGEHLPRRRQRVHAVAARPEELSLPQGSQRPRRRAARWLRRRRVPACARPGPGRN